MNPSLPCEPTRKRCLMLGAGLALLLMAVDQASKYYLLHVAALLERAPVEITSFFNLVVVWNRGVSFGMFSNHPDDLRLALIALALAISAWLGFWLTKAADRFEAAALGAIIGGALGNVVDRILYGAVFDFLDFHLKGWHYPAFNVADSAIVIGVLCLLIHGFWRPRSA